MSTKHLIFLVHGIRDAAFWQDKLSQHLKDHANTEVISVKTEVIHLLAFLAPIHAFRRKYINDLKREIVLGIDGNKDAKVTVIAHSFGTYGITRILHEDTSIKIDKLIMCGAVVPNNFRWDQVQIINFEKRKKSIINEYSSLDCWPVLAKFCATGYGNVGYRGCGKAPVTDRQHYTPHHGYLGTDFAKKFWDPFIFKNKIVRSRAVPGEKSWSQKITGPLLKLITRLPFNLMKVSLGAGALAACVLSYYWLHHTGHFFAKLEFEQSQRDPLVLPNIKITGTDHTENAENVFVNHKVADHKIIALSRDNVSEIEVRVNNRPEIKCDADDSGEPIPDTPMNKRQSTYYISYEPATLWQNIWSFNWTGEARLRFDYRPKFKLDDKPISTDRLVITPGTGIKPGTTSVRKIAHDPDDCYDKLPEHKDRLVHISTADNVQTAGIIDIINRAWAGTLSAKQKQIQKDISKYLNSPDGSTREFGRSAIRQRPDLHRKNVNELFSDPSRLKEPELVNLLSDITDATSGPIKLDNTALRQVFLLTWDERYRVRSSARKFLRSKGVATPQLARRLTGVVETMLPDLRGKKLADGRLEKLYLALISIRDIYYNYAIYTFDETAEIGKGKPDIASRIDDIMRSFDGGMKIANLASRERKEAFAKNIYGKALVAFRAARIRDAVGSPYHVLAPEKINKLIKAKMKSGAHVRRKTKFANVAVDEFKNFLRFVDGGERNRKKYPWERHIRQAERCVNGPQKLRYDCLTQE